VTLILLGLALDVNAFGDGTVLGCDFSGTVLDVHPSVSKLKNGDSIAGFVWGGGLDALLICVEKLT
jgi:NADPH:quinone reductase-like Zn-dependent oxidoreductase